MILHDTLDDRREMIRAMSKISPRRRVQFVNACCQKTTKPGALTFRGVAQRTRDLADLATRDSSADERLTLELFFDLWHLHLQYNLDMHGALILLERLARGRK